MFRSSSGILDRLRVRVRVRSRGRGRGRSRGRVGVRGGVVWRFRGSSLDSPCVEI